MTRLKRKKELSAKTEEDLRFGTPQMVAQHRAKRLAALGPNTIIEIGAGAGFQTSAFASAAKSVIAVDIDEEKLSRADFPENVIPVIGDAMGEEAMQKIQEKAEGKTTIFLDPERPATSPHRTLAEIRPDIKEFLRIYSAITPDIAIEMPPFLSKEELEQLPLPFEREYLSVDGRLNRLTLYFGGLRRCGVSAVRLPEGERVEGNAPLAEVIIGRSADAQYVLVPDAALAQAHLVGEALAQGGNHAVHPVALGNKHVYLCATRVKSKLFKAYRIVSSGPRREIERALTRCSALILHGKMTEEEQRKLLKELRPFCRGRERLHLFLGERWYLAGD
jgi:hypothetical protein